MEFYIALFGILYFGCKYLGKKIDDEYTAQQNIIASERIDRLRKEWEDKVVDREFENEIEEIIYYKGDLYTANINYLRDLFPSMVITDRMITMYMMAQKCKIPYYIAKEGIESVEIFSYGDRLQWLRQREFVIWYNKELQRNGLSDKLLFIKGRVSRGSEVKQISELDKPIYGNYIWEPMTYLLR